MEYGISNPTWLVLVFPLLLPCRLTRYQSCPGWRLRQTIHSLVWVVRTDLRIRRRSRSFGLVLWLVLFLRVQLLVGLHRRRLWSSRRIGYVWRAFQIRRLWGSYRIFGRRFCFLPIMNWSIQPWKKHNIPYPLPILWHSCIVSSSHGQLDGNHQSKELLNNQHCRLQPFSERYLQNYDQSSSTTPTHLPSLSTTRNPP